VDRRSIPAQKVFGEIERAFVKSPSQDGVSRSHGALQILKIAKDKRLDLNFTEDKKKRKQILRLIINISAAFYYSQSFSITISLVFLFI